MASGGLRVDESLAQDSILGIQVSGADVAATSLTNTEMKQEISDSSNTCWIEGCERTDLIKSHGWCRMHQQRWQKYGDPTFKAQASPGEPRRWLKEALATRDRLFCWIWPFGKDSAGYPQLHPGRATYESLILDGHPRPDPPNHFCLHSCDQPSCVNPSHLRWGSNRENVKDMIDRGRDRFYTEGRPWANQYYDKQGNPYKLGKGTEVVP